MHIRKNSLGLLQHVSSLSLPQPCCLNCFNTAVQCIILPALTLKKASPLVALSLDLLLRLHTGQAKRSSHAGHIHTLRLASGICLGSHVRSRADMRGSSSPLAVTWDLGISEERMKSLRLLGGSFCREFISVLPQMCDTFSISMSEKGRSHGRCTAMPVQPLFAERKGAESYPVRNCFIFWLMSESFSVTALIRLITATLVNKMCLRLLSESNTHPLTAPR